MLNISKIENRKTATNKKDIKKVQEILRAQFPGLEDEYISNLPLTIFSGPRLGFRYWLYVIKNEAAEIEGFVIFSYFPRYFFYFLDHLAVLPGLEGKGIGRELYEFVRNEAREMESVGIFMECLNDDPATVPDEAHLKQNIARLRFYERFGARPIANNLFSQKVNEKSNSTLLVFDPLDKEIVLSRDQARKIVRKIIQKKYSDFCPPDYIKKVVMSFRDNPIKLREKLALPPADGK